MYGFLGLHVEAKSLACLDLNNVMMKYFQFYYPTNDRILAPIIIYWWNIYRISIEGYGEALRISEKDMALKPQIAPQSALFSAT